MYADTYQPPSSQRMASGALALGLHAVLLAVLVFSLHFQKQPEPVVNMVDLWAALPTPQPASIPPPPPAPVVKETQPPKPEPEVKPPPALPKPDIALKAEKEKAEKEKKLQEQKKQEDLKRQQDLEQAQIQREKAEDAKAQAQAAAAAAQASMLQKYTGLIRDQVRKYIVMPPNMPPDIRANFQITILPTGEVVDAHMLTSSGNALWDQAVERAIIRAQPLPMPPDPAVLAQLRSLKIGFTPGNQ